LSTNNYTTIFVSMICLLLSACNLKPGGYDVTVNHDKPEEVARAEVLSAQAAAIRAKTATDRERALIETKVYATTAELNMTMATKQREAEILARTTQANADAQVWEAIGVSLSSVVYGIGMGLIIAEVVAAICLTLYVAIELLIRLRQAPAKSRAITVTGYVNNTRMDMIIFQDNNNDWHIIDPLEGSRGQINQSRGAQAMRMHLLSNFAQPALPAPTQQQRPQQEGLLVRAWHFLFNRKLAARKMEIIE